MDEIWLWPPWRHRHRASLGVLWCVGWVHQVRSWTGLLPAVPSMFGGQLFVLLDIPEQFVRGVSGRVVLLSGGRRPRPRFEHFWADVPHSNFWTEQTDRSNISCDSLKLNAASSSLMSAVVKFIVNVDRKFFVINKPDNYVAPHPAAQGDVTPSGSSLLW